MSNVAGTPARFGPIEAFQRGIQNYTNFEGRANRPEFWWWVLATFVIGVVANIIDLFLPGQFVSLLVNLALLLPGLAIGARRLHDTNRTALWLLLIITFIGIIVLVVFWCEEGTAGPNDHGEPSTVGQQ